MRTQKDLYDVLEGVLKKAKGTPFTAVKLFDKPEVKEHATSVNRVSDYLGNLWRRGTLVRLPFSGDRDQDGSRWMYQWKGAAPPKPSAPIVYEPKKVVFEKTGVKVYEEGKNIVIDTGDFSIVIRPQPRREGLPD